LGQITGKFIAAVKSFAAREGVPLFHFERKESKDERAKKLRHERAGRDAVVFIGIAQEKAKAFSARRLPGKRALFEFTRSKSVIPNYYYFYLDDAEWGRVLHQGLQLCAVGTKSVSQRSRVAQTPIGQRRDRFPSTG